jgi:SAM-dependent methyltransferase
VIKCKICNSEMKKYLKKYDKITKNYFEYYKCSNKDCGLLSIYPEPSDKTLSEIYGYDYYKSWGDYYNYRDIINKQKQDTFSDIIKLLDIKENDKVLDCGCATGALIQLGLQLKWDIYGFDINPVSKEESKLYTKEERVYNCDIFGLPFEDKTFDYIFMLDFIEHPRNPEEYIKKSFGLLKENGKLIITTPNFQSLSRKILRKNWPHFLNEHINIFSQNSIKLLLKKYFRKISIKNNYKILTLKYFLEWIYTKSPNLFAKSSNLALKLIPIRLHYKKIKIKTGEILIICKK